MNNRKSRKTRSCFTKGSLWSWWSH